MLDDETRAFLEGGCALLVGTVADDGAPHAGRGWGLAVLEGGLPVRCRVLLDADDERTLANVAGGGSISVTATSVLTLRSMQLKGRAVGPEVPTPDDERRAASYLEEFFGHVHEVDGVAWEVFESILPSGHVACVFEAHDTFDQTPGPGAGARVEGTDGG